MSYFYKAVGNRGYRSYLTLKILSWHATSIEPGNRCFSHGLGCRVQDLWIRELSSSASMEPNTSPNYGISLNHMGAAQTGDIWGLHGGCIGFRVSGFPKLGVSSWGVPIIWIIVFCGLLGSP